MTTTPTQDATVRLTEWTSCGGCAAKWGAGLLAELVEELSGSAGAELGLLAGLAPSDDAAVVMLSDDLALVSTTDFFPPLVDDPYDFGAVAAANACSDIFAMGGRVVLALNLAAFPEALPRGAIAAILAGARDTVSAAGGQVAGGHTIRSEEPIFGLAVQGTLHPRAVWRKGGSRPGDVLAISKPLGTGLVLAGGTDADKDKTTRSMKTLNRDAAEVLACLDGEPHAVTDVTGFGLAGHAWEIAERSEATLSFDRSALPLLDGARTAAEAGVRTGGDVRNRDHLAGRVSFAADGDDGEVTAALVFDPQTSGGLLASVDKICSEELADQGFTIVGEVRPGPAAVVFE
ncbi:MAG: selenide, water dikinase SelD [Actinobacteria bacterium]|nr:selenide, water dikinase SelD [Actinomycetota bacterium]